MTPAGTATSGAPTARTVHVVLPGGVDDPANPSGGNHYDRRVCDGLTASGWTVREHAVTGTWPHPGRDAAAELAATLAALPADALVLADGLVALGAPEAVAARRAIVLAHMVFGDADPGVAPAERTTLRAAAAVVTTSSWCRTRLIDRYGLRPDLVHFASPGVDAAQLVPGGIGGDRLLCLAAVAPHKGHDVLVTALSELAGLDWHCCCVGPTDRDPGFVRRLRHAAAPLADRFVLLGPRTGPALDEIWARTDLLVLATRGESYGMVVAEALARGIPVLATEVQGLPEALGHAPDGSLPGLLVPPEDPVAFAAALRRWLTEPDLRTALRRAALARRSTLTGWDRTTAEIGGVLASLVADRPPGAR
ncbi:glycosyltransferase family 4 protein [Catellatospora tritici]|uniref:glycosyltransferase family 4 protein n=1 Tax=Catellatospora tritici TaxID=2851566 RepID=UPI001C2D6834|nr:glycosyltransferase family 4 protein [Catellatospora tritici]MBV1855932.1 glycosyltransferase family 4 protein [Catellatospora tritici]